MREISIVHSVEMIRDGGSLAASYSDMRGNNYWLMFQIVVDETDPSNAVRVAFERPVICERITGVNNKISWEEADAMLDRILGLISDEQHASWCSTMKDVVTLEGGLPPNIPATVGPARRLQTENDA